MGSEDNMPAAPKNELPFSARYSLPAHLSGSLGEVSWETVIQLSTDFQASSEEKGSRVKKIVKELQMSRLLLMDKIRQASVRGEGIDPKILVDVVRLLKKCEEVAEQYDVDLRSFSTFLYMLAEKLKKEKLARHSGERELSRIRPIKEELEKFKERSENPDNSKRRKKRKGG